MAGPATISLPSFSGATRRLVLINLGVFFFFAVLGLFSGPLAARLLQWLWLVPAEVAHGQVWRLVTYGFLNLGVLQALLGLLSLWYIGSWLEGEFGARWIYEVYFTSMIGAAVLASALSYTHLFGITEALPAADLNAAVFGLLIAAAKYFGDQEIRFMFVITLKVRYMVAIYIVFYLALLLRDGSRFDALVQLCGAASAWLYLRFVPRKGLSFAASELGYGMRNNYLRNKRRKAAKQFEVYMGKRGREVKFDDNGKFVDPDAGRDPNDKKWMN